jgi:hypothetical protein
VNRARQEVETKGDGEKGSSLLEDNMAYALTRTNECKIVGRKEHGATSCAASSSQCNQIEYMKCPVLMLLIG